MPNHVTNVLRIRAEGERLDEVLAAIRDEKLGDGSIDFDKLIPMPKSLDIESGSRTDEGIELFLTAANPNSKYTVPYVEKMDALEFKDVLETLNSRKYFTDYNAELTGEEMREMLRHGGDLRELIEFGRTAVANTQNYGAKDWYDWRLKNWGTKWNAYDQGDTEEKSKIRFSTAWSAPTPVIAKLAQMFPDVGFEHEWADEDLGYNVGRREYENGEESSCYIPDGENDALHMALEIMGVEPEEYGYRENPITGLLEYTEDMEYEFENEGSTVAGPEASL